MQSANFNINPGSIDSRIVAGFFGKTHNEILYAIESIDCSTEFYEENFQGAMDENAVAVYLITPDGIIYLMMSLDGPDVAKFKEHYVCNSLYGPIDGFRRENSFTPTTVKDLMAIIPQSGPRPPFFTYLIKDKTTGNTKIGKSRTPIERIHAVRKAHPHPTIILGVTDVPEIELHKQFRDKRLNGEWFSLADEDIQSLNLRAVPGYLGRN